MAGALVSILMVTYNHRDFVVRAIRSVLAQDSGDWELVIYDDGSTDGTPEQAASCADPRIRLVRGAHRGMREAYRAGIAECGGVYLAFLEGDDEWLPSNLSRKLDAFRRFPEVGLVYSGVRPEGEPREVARAGAYLRRAGKAPRETAFDASGSLALMNPVPTFSTAIVRRELLNGVEFPPEAFTPWLDWFFWNHAGSRSRFFFIPDELVVWRRRGSGFYRGLERAGFIRVKAKELYLRFLFAARLIGAACRRKRQ